RSERVAHARTEQAAAMERLAGRERAHGRAVALARPRRPPERDVAVAGETTRDLDADRAGAAAGDARASLDRLDRVPVLADRDDGPDHARGDREQLHADVEPVCRKGGVE